MSNSADLAFAGIPVLAQKLRQREVSAVELAKLFLDRLELLGDEFNAVITITRRLALSKAARADDELAAGIDRGPLHGIPYGVKDLLATAEIPTTWGAEPFRNQMFDDDAAVIKKLDAAGAVLVAKLAMVELSGALGYDGPNATFTGPGRNPWNVDAWAGGSSHGVGAAVAAGLVPFAIASETVGSLIDPACYCGVTGLRPTYGRVSRNGAMPLSWSLDKLGPVCRSANECGLVLRAIAGHDDEDETTAREEFEFPPSIRPQPPFKLATLKGDAEHLQPSVRRNFEQALSVLSPFASVEEIQLPKLPFREVAMTIFSCEMATAFEGFLESGDARKLTSPQAHIGGFAPQFIPARDYINAQRIRRRIVREMTQLLRPYDAIISPTLPVVAPPLDCNSDEYFCGYNSVPELAVIGNLVGIPAVTIPNGFGERDLPTGMQFIGKAFSESLLLTLAHGYQSLTTWHQQSPTLQRG